MTTVHANTPRDALIRLENMVSMAGMNFPVRAIRQQITSALDLVVHVARLTGGRRRITSVAEVVGMEGDVVCLQDLFVFNQTGVGDDGQAVGRFESCGVRPRVVSRLASEGYSLPARMFARRVMKVIDAGEKPKEKAARK